MARKECIWGQSYVVITSRAVQFSLLEKYITVPAHWSASGNLPWKHSDQHKWTTQVFAYILFLWSIAIGLSYCEGKIWVSVLGKGIKNKIRIIFCHLCSLNLFPFLLQCQERALYYICTLYYLLSKLKGKWKSCWYQASGYLEGNFFHFLPFEYHNMHYNN